MKAETIDKIFAWILSEAARTGYLKPEAVFIDGTYIKANANTKKKIETEVPIAAKRYANELLEEINNDREEPDFCLIQIRVLRQSKPFYKV